MHNFHLYETTERVLDSINELIEIAEVMERSEVLEGTEKIMATCLYLKLDQAGWIASELMMMAETGKRSPQRTPPWIGALTSHEKRVRNERAIKETECK
jgi:hypothetical protein